MIPEAAARAIRSGIVTARRDMADMTGDLGYTAICVEWNGKKRDRPFFDAYSRTIRAHRYGLTLRGLVVSADLHKVKMERWR